VGRRQGGRKGDILLNIDIPTKKMKEFNKLEYKETWVEDIIF
jgi:hypothetical protein